MKTTTRNRIENVLNETHTEEDLRLLLEDMERDASVAVEFARARELKGLLHVLEFQQDHHDNLDTIMQAVAADRQAPVTADRVIAKIRRRRVLPILVALAACVAIVAGVALTRSSDGEGAGVTSAPAVAYLGCRVSQHAAGVRLIRGGAAVPIDSSQGLVAGDWLLVPEGGTAEISYVDETYCRLESKTRLQIGDHQQGKSMLLEVGRVFWSVSKQPADQPLRIESPHAEIRVVGTAFYLEASTVSTQVNMLSGLVQMRSRTGEGHWMAVSSGEAATVHQQRPDLSVDEIRHLPSSADQSSYLGWKQHRDKWLADASLVAYYDFEQSLDAAKQHLLVNQSPHFRRAEDALRNANGHISNANWTDGRFPGLKRALYFDGKSHVDAGSSLPNRIKGPLSVVCWFKVSTFDAQWQSLIGTGMDGFGIQRYYKSNSLEFYYRADGKYLNAQGRMPVRDGKWHCAVGVFDGAHSLLYVDGKLDAKVSARGQFNANGATLTIGANSRSEVTRRFKGWMDEVAIFNRALSPLEIAQIWRDLAPVE